MLLQTAQAAHAIAGAHPLQGTAAEWMWLLPLLPLLGFVINGLLSLVPACPAAPADPDMGHAAHTGGHAAHAAGDAHGAHGDDHHPVARHKHAGLVSLVGPAVLAASFVLATMIFLAMRGAEVVTPFVQTYFSWMP